MIQGLNAGNGNLSLNNLLLETASWASNLWQEFSCDFELCKSPLVKVFPNQLKHI